LQPDEMLKRLDKLDWFTEFWRVRSLKVARHLGCTDEQQTHDVDQILSCMQLKSREEIQNVNLRACFTLHSTPLLHISVHTFLFFEWIGVKRTTLGRIWADTWPAYIRHCISDDRQWWLFFHTQCSRSTSHWRWRGEGTEGIKWLLVIF
jgi:hypothetical protein